MTIHFILYLFDVAVVILVRVSLTDVENDILLTTSIHLPIEYNSPIVHEVP